MDMAIILSKNTGAIFPHELGVYERLHRCNEVGSELNFCIRHNRHKNCLSLVEFFEEILICKVYRDGDKPTFVRLLKGGGRAQTLGFQCLTDSGPLKFIFVY